MKKIYKKKYLLQISLMFVAIVAIGCPTTTSTPPTTSPPTTSPPTTSPPTTSPPTTSPPTTRPLPTTGGRTCRLTICTNRDTGATLTGYVAFGSVDGDKCYRTEAECRNNRYCFNSAGNGCTAGYYTCPDSTTRCASTLSLCRALPACSSE